jgi:hypothetical protein
MQTEITCGECGRRLRLTEGLAGRPVRCPACGAEWRTPDDDAAPRAGTADDDLPPVALEEEGFTAGTPGARYPEEACPKCGAAMAAGAVLCLDCGFDRRTGRQREVVHKRLHRRWASDWPYLVRLLFFVVFEAAAVLAFGAVAAHLSPWWLLPLLPLTPLLAFWTGGYHAVEIDRTHKGRLKVHSHRWIAFIPLRPRTAVVQPGDALVLADVGRFNPLEWLVLFLTTPRYGGWAWASTGPEAAPIYVSFRLLLRCHGSRDLLLYRGADETKMRDIVETIQKAVEVPLQRR